MGPHEAYSGNQAVGSVYIDIGSDMNPQRAQPLKYIAVLRRASEGSFIFCLPPRGRARSVPDLHRDYPGILIVLISFWAGIDGMSGMEKWDLIL